MQVIPGGSGEILTCDWTKYDQVKFVERSQTVNGSVLVVPWARSRLCGWFIVTIKDKL